MILKSIFIIFLYFLNFYFLSITNIKKNFLKSLWNHS